jgi:hypothetical protein
MHFSIFEFTNIYLPNGKGEGALSVLLAVLIFTDVFVTSKRGVGTFSIPFAILPLS